MSQIAQSVANIALAIALLLLLVRFLVDRFNINPFGRFAYYARRPTNRWFYEIKGSQFYHPIRKAFGFDPVWVLLLLAFVLLFFLLRSLVGDVVLLLNCIGSTLIAFGLGDSLAGGKALIGTILLGLIYFLMAMMTILVINSWFGLFDRAGFWAGRRIYPILNSFDPSGRLGPLVFLLVFFLLQLVAGAVLAAFF
ncbi:MAG: hypothetical protein ACREEM_50220 [Blastocatellia bacterium]